MTKGQLVALSGDPDLTCVSRPHLHFEVRSLDFRTAYNPVDYIDAPWHVLGSIGSFGSGAFQQDLFNTRRWMSLDDQPSIIFGGAPLNNYRLSWPPRRDERIPPNAIPMRALGPLPEDSTWRLRPLETGGCCPGPWWHPADPNRLYAIDGIAGERASVFEWRLAEGGPPTPVSTAPPPLLSPDGTHQILADEGRVVIRRLFDNTEWPVQTSRSIPALSADNSRLLWQVQRGTFVPGRPAPRVEVWVSDLDGSNPVQIMNQQGIGAQWLDGARLLLSMAAEQKTTLIVHDTRDHSAYVLGTWLRLRGLSVAPGGGRLLFYLTAQPDNPAADGVYTIETRQGAQTRQLPWFGGWRWRDADSVYYIPFDARTARQTLAYYHIPTGENRLLTDVETMPITIANGDWAVAPDGRRIVFVNAEDKNLWLLEEVGAGS